MKSFCKVRSHKLAAYTLTEVLVVLIIIGILILLALPNLMPLITKAKSTEAKVQLEYVYNLEKSFFFEKSRYSNSTEELSFEQPKLVTEGGQANYKIEIKEINEKGFTAKATAIVDFDADGVFNVWEINQDKKLIEVTKD